MSEAPLTEAIRPDGPPLDRAAYERTGGYQALRETLGHVAPAEVIRRVKDANLRGRGGAGFPTGVKWSLVPAGPQAPRPKYLVANADEMEPGTFKDRFLLEGNPHQLLEGLILAAYAVGAEFAYIFLRWAYKEAAQILRRAIAEAEKLSGSRPRIIHTSARTAGGTSYGELRAMMEFADAPPMLLLLGTGFGMAKSVADRADIILAPVLGPGDYNHLSVRSAAGIVLDRLRGH